MGTGKKKIEIKKKEKALDRMVTFSKRKKGLFKKAFQLHELSGSEIAILVFSPAGRPHINTPFFDAALARYWSSIEAQGSSTSFPSNDDVGLGHSGRSEDDSSVGMCLNSVEGFLLEGTEGSRNRLNPVESHLVGEGAASTSYCSARENHSCIREWLNSIDVEGIERVEDLVLMKQRLENIREKVAKKFDGSSYFA